MDIDSLVEKTRSHSEFYKQYAGHIPALLPKTDWKSHKLLAIDCEMCETVRDPNALTRVSVVDEHGEVLLDKFVVPEDPIVNYNTHITGITSKTLRRVKFKQADAQQALSKLITHDTVLVGHSLYHDLRALNIVHPTVIDTAMIFQHQDSTAFPSLKELVRVVLKQDDFQVGVHSSVSDAQAALELVQHELKSGPTPPLPLPNLNSNNQLLIHRIDPELRRGAILSLFRDSKPELKWLKLSKGFYKMVATFERPEDCQNVWESFPGIMTIDNNTFGQKKIYLGVNTYVYIRTCWKLTSL